MALPVSMLIPLLSRLTNSVTDTPCHMTAMAPPVNTPSKSAGMDGNLIALNTSTSTTGTSVTGLMVKLLLRVDRISLVVAASYALLYPCPMTASMMVVMAKAGITVNAMDFTWRYKSICADWEASMVVSDMGER